ncbi:hypothetical protein HNQ91_002076 [Filimonas zeae]|uniref:Outer membrane protein Omp28 n=1 Tax=Filimonas zeae TaxID=1737353 RepID=A0A917MUT9_9BACT|nr:Omp28-related outer membrane protein [Filimonas zeae]MDR6339025.1 hypothetical protein [Filimonas zeae]GGH65462.1 hypothetical protein GCM10011379_18620 [Filimonas zeae]
MRKFVCGTLLLAAAIAGTTSSCSKGDSGPSVPDSLKVSLSATTLSGTGFDGVTVTVKDRSGADVTGAVQLYADGVKFTGPVFYPDKVKTVKISAQKGSVPSNIAEVVVTAPEASPFTQKILVEDFTGTWCKYCTRAADILTRYTSKQPACISVGVHGGRAGEPFTYQYLNTFMDRFAIDGFPWAVLNRDSKWNENPALLDAALKKWAPLGLAIESKIESGNITGKVKVKFNLTTNVDMRVVIMLVEDKLVADQENAYAEYGTVPTIKNYVHTNTLRRIASDDVFSGDPIPSTAVTKGNVWEKTFSLSTTGRTGIGTDYTAIPANCKVVAFVQYGPENSTGRKGAINVQYTNAGDTKDFD